MTNFILGDTNRLKKHEIMLNNFDLAAILTSQKSPNALMQQVFYINFSLQIIQMILLIMLMSSKKISQVLWNFGMSVRKSNFFPSDFHSNLLKRKIKPRKRTYSCAFRALVLKGLKLEGVAYNNQGEGRGGCIETYAKKPHWHFTSVHIHCWFFRLFH